MFGKLLKNDLKAQWHSMSTLFLAIIISTVGIELAVLFADHKVIKALGGGAVRAVLLFACVVILVAVSSAFSKTMFGRAGYLTMSLPVKTGSLVASKTVSGLIWIFAVYALFVGSFALWVSQVYDALGEEMLSTVEDLLSMFGVPSMATISIGVTAFCISLAATVLVAVQALYLGETLSHVSPVSKFGKFGAIIIFFAVFLIVLKISEKCSSLADIGMVITDDAISFTTEAAKTRKEMNGAAMTVGFTSTIVRLIIGIAMHFPITKLVKDKVNIG